MINKKEILDILDKKIKGIENAILSGKISRDMAPSAMESHSDTTRSEKEKLVYALEKELDNLKALKDEDLNPIIYRIKIGNDTKNICLVPEGLGGENKGEIKLVSSISPLGLNLINKKAKDEFVFNNQTIKVLSVLATGPIL